MPGMWNKIRTMDEALHKFRENYRELGLIIHKQEKLIQFLETKALNMSMFYVSFQWLIFLWMNSNQIPADHQCTDTWKHFVLSLSIAVVFGLNFTTTVAKYMRIKYEQDRNFMDQQENYHHMAYLRRLGSDKSGVDILTNIDVDDHVLPKSHMEEGHRLHEPDILSVYQRYAHLSITASVLLALTVLILHTCWPSAICANSV